LNKLNELIKSITDSKTVKRFKELEKIVDHNEKLQNEFKLLLDLQKILVQKEFANDSLTKKANEEYEIQKQKVLQHLVVEEYLELLDEINEDLALIKSIIEQEINVDFD